jgi:hypothetical protein
LGLNFSKRPGVLDAILADTKHFDVSPACYWGQLKRKNLHVSALQRLELTG